MSKRWHPSFNPRPTGGGAISSPPLISETTGPILKIQAAFESLGQTVMENKFYWPRGHEWRHRSGQSQNVRHFGLGDIGEQNWDVKHKQSQPIGMDSVSDICMYHLLCFAAIIEVKVMSGHQVNRSSKKIRNLELRYMFSGQIFAKNAKNNPKTLFEASKSVKK